MTLEQLVPTLDLCQQLKAAGFPQDTALRWCLNLTCDFNDLSKPAVEGSNVWPSTSRDVLCAAPTAEEILKELPETVGKDEMCLDVFGDGDTWMVGWYRYKHLFGWMKEWHGEQPGIVMKPLIEVAADAYLWWKKGVAG